jgi:DNA-binding protein YbaB
MAVEWNNELTTSLEGFAADFGQRMEELRGVREELRKVHASARTRDGAVSVEVGPHGELLDIKFDPRLHDRLSSQRLAMTIMTLVGEAKAEASQKAQEITAEFLPEQLAARVRDGDDPTDLLPGLPSMLYRRHDQ